MDKRKHTSEPWNFRSTEEIRERYDGTHFSHTYFLVGTAAEDSYDYDPPELRDTAGQLVAKAYKRADALRLTTCVNACEGINPEAVPELLKAVSRLIQCHRAEDQPGTYVVLIERDDMDAARAAFAKATS